MRELYKGFFDFFASLRLTVVLLVLSMVLVFVATLDQVNLGVWAIQEKYFRSLFLMWFIPGTRVPIPYFPGGYLLGSLLFLNLIAGFAHRFRLEWKKAGIWLSHAGLILLLLGELLSGLLQEDYQMSLTEGETRSYSESFHDIELAVINTTSPDFDEVVAIPSLQLQRHENLQHPKLPFRVVTKAYFPNAVLSRREGDARGPVAATQGIGVQIDAFPAPVSYSDNNPNSPVAFIEIIGENGSLGTWLLSNQLGAPQGFVNSGKTWKLALRSARRYTPFSLTLLKVTHETYPGSDIPKNFASRVRIQNATTHDDREVLIYMNNPLRYDGLTFYQYQMNASNHNSVFQVVRNPSWLLPYVACVMMGAGLLGQFTISLFGFLKKRK